MLVCNVLRGQIERVKVEKYINNFLLSMQLELEDFVISQVVRGDKIITTIKYKRQSKCGKKNR